jgi:hypothetical protein
MQQYQNGQRVIIRAMDENGEVQPQALYGFAAVVGSYPEINPDAADKEGRENDYLLATLNKDLEVNLFVGYSPAKCLTLVEGEELVSGLLEELEECRDELEPDEDGDVLIVVRDDVDGNEFSPEDYEGDLQLTRVTLGGEVIGIWPTESLAVAANNLKRLVSYSSLLSLVEGLEVKTPKQDATEEERATFIPATLPNKLGFDRDSIVELGYQLIDFADYRRKEERNNFKESVENIPAIPSERFKPAYFESPFQILSELKDAITDLADESRLTEGSDILLEFEPFVANVCEWEDFGFDPTVEMEDDEDEDDSDDDEFEAEEIDDEEEEETPARILLSNEKVESIHEVAKLAMHKAFTADPSVVVLDAKTVHDNETVMVTVLIASSEADLHAAQERFNETFDLVDDEEEDEEDFEDEDEDDEEDDDFAEPKESNEIISLRDSLSHTTREELERICVAVDIAHKGFTDKKIRERLIDLAKKSAICTEAVSAAVTAARN